MDLAIYAPYMYQCTEFMKYVGILLSIFSDLNSDI